VIVILSNTGCIQVVYSDYTNHQVLVIGVDVNDEPTFAFITEFIISEYNDCV